MSKNAKRFDKSPDRGLVIKRTAGEGVLIGDQTLRVLECRRGAVKVQIDDEVELNLPPGRKVGIGGIVVGVIECGSGSVRFLFSGPRDVRILRDELALLTA